MSRDRGQPWVPLSWWHYTETVNGAQGTPRDSSPSTVFLQLSFTAPTGGGAGAEISPPCSLLFLMCYLVPGVHLSSMKVSILELSANYFNTCPQFAPGMSCSLANFCQLIGGGAGGWCLRSRSTASLSQVTVKIWRVGFFVLPCLAGEFQNVLDYISVDILEWTHLLKLLLELFRDWFDIVTHLRC